MYLEESETMKTIDISQISSGLVTFVDINHNALEFAPKQKQAKRL